jgi:hypothetical protein
MNNQINCFFLWVLAHAVAGGIGTSLSSFLTVNWILPGPETPWFLLGPLLMVTLVQWGLLRYWPDMAPDWLPVTLGSVLVLGPVFILAFHIPLIFLLYLFYDLFSYYGLLPQLLLNSLRLVFNSVANIHKGIIVVNLGTIIGISQSLLLTLVPGMMARSRPNVLVGWTLASIIGWTAVFTAFIYNQYVPAFPRPLLGLITIGGVYGSLTGLVLLTIMPKPLLASTWLERGLVLIGIPLILISIMSFGPYWRFQNQQVLYAKTISYTPSFLGDAFVFTLPVQSGIYITKAGDVFVFSHHRESRTLPVYTPYQLFREEFAFSGHWVMRVEPDVLAEMIALTGTTAFVKEQQITNCARKHGTIYIVYNYDARTGRHTPFCFEARYANQSEETSPVIEWLDSLYEQFR